MTKPRTDLRCGECHKKLVFIYDNPDAPTGNWCHLEDKTYLCEWAIPYVEPQPQSDAWSLIEMHDRDEFPADAHCQDQAEVTVKNRKPTLYLCNGHASMWLAVDPTAQLEPILSQTAIWTQIGGGMQRPGDRPAHTRTSHNPENNTIKPRVLP